MTESDLKDLATKAYIYGYPLVYNVTEVLNYANTPKTSFAAPVNMFGHARTLAGPSDEFVSLNNDTLYAMAQVDVTDEPQVLHLPDTNDRYYVMQFVDAWTNNFAYLGRRATGTDEQRWLLAGPGWSGEVPEGLRVVHAPTNVFTIVGRFAVNGEADLPNVHALQDETWLTPLSQYPNRPETGNRTAGDRDIAPFDTSVPAPLTWWEKFRAWSQLLPPADADTLARFAPLGVLERASPYRDADPGLAATLEAGQAEGEATITQIARSGFDQPVNGWNSALHSFDYNTHVFEVGTVDDGAWKINDPARAMATRAASAMGGLWGNHGYEAAYFWAFVDEDGEPLNGARRYTITFQDLPPVDAFWSMTMYDTPRFYLVENAIGRYSIGDRTPGLVFGEDGSLTIHVQRDDPGGEMTANWLPAPAGDFRPLMRMYQPGASILDGRYVLPPFRRVR